MPRSGSTLQFRIVTSLLQRNDIAFDNLGYKSFSEISDFSWDTVNSDIVVIKCHDLDAYDVTAPFSSIFRLFVYRDVRDAYLSGKEKWGLRVDHIESLVMSHKSTLELAQKHADVLVQKYESVYSDNAKAVSEIAEYINTPASDEAVRKVLLDVKPVGPGFLGQCFLFLKRAARYRRKLPIPEPRVEIAFKRWCERKLLRLAVDPMNQLHPDHISGNKGKPGAWEFDLIEEEFAEFHRLGIR